MHDQNQHFPASIRNPCLQVICFSILNWVLPAISKDLHAYMALFKHCLHMIYKGNGTQLHLQQNCLYSYSYKHMREQTSRFNPSFFPAVHWPEYQSNWEPFAFCFAQRQHSWQHSIKPKCVTHMSPSFLQEIKEKSKVVFLGVLFSDTGFESGEKWLTGNRKLLCHQF